MKATVHKRLLIYISALFISISCKTDYEENLPELSSNEEVKLLRKEIIKLNDRITSIERKKTSNTTVGLPDFIATSKNVKNSVVGISALTEYKTRWGTTEKGEGSGSGVIISENGYIATNNHVIDGSHELKVILNDKRIFPAKIIGIDPTTDIALLKIEARGLPVINFADSDDVFVGEWVLAVGNPLNLSSTVTAGIVSAKSRSINILNEKYSIESFIQTDAVVNPGNSGGALVDVSGNLVGINTSIVTQSGRYEGYSFAVPSNIVKKVTADLKDYGQVQRGILGISIRDMTATEAKSLNLPAPLGVYIERVFEGGAAFDADIKNNDVILAINDKSLSSYTSLQEVVAQYRPGDTLTLTILRDDKTIEKELTLKDKNNSVAITPKEQKDILDYLGITVRELTKEEIKNNGIMGGIKVLSVVKRSPIDQSGMSSNFIITRINNKKVTTKNQMWNAIIESSNNIHFEGIYENRKGKFQYIIK